MEPETTYAVPAKLRVMFVEMTMLLLWPILMLSPLGAAAVDTDQLYSSALVAATLCRLMVSWAFESTAAGGGKERKRSAYTMRG
jgi:hypothetical protein